MTHPLRLSCDAVPDMGPFAALIGPGVRIGADDLAKRAGWDYTGMGRRSGWRKAKGMVTHIGNPNKRQAIDG